MAITFNRVTKWIIPDTDIVTVQEIYNASQNYLDEPGNLDLEIFIRASGKDVLSDTEFTGITITITEGWRIRWEPRPPSSPEFILRRITGGNLAQNEFGELPLAPTDGNTIVVQASVSATILNINELAEAIAVGGEIFIDSIDGVAGTEFPIGTESSPVSNIADGITIADERGINRFRIRGAHLFNIARPGSEWRAFGGASTRFILGPLADLHDTRFEEILLVSGDAGMDSESPLGIAPRMQGCAFLGPIDNIFGLMDQCFFRDATLTPPAGTIDFMISKGSSAKPGSDPGLTLDLVNGGGLDINVRAFAGGTRILNSTDASNLISVGFTDGSITLDASSTAGTLVVRGNGNINGAELSGMTIIRDGLMVGAQQRDLWQLQGLDPDNPMTVDLLAGRRFVGLGSPAVIEQLIVEGSPEGVTVVTRTK